MSASSPRHWPVNAPAEVVTARQVIDDLIAATTQEFGLTVVTRNASYFNREGVGVRVVNPFG